MRLRDDVEVLAGVQRQGHARRGREIAAPHAAAVHDVLGRDVAALAVGFPVDAGDAAVALG